MKKRAILTTIVAAMLAVCMFSLTACAGNVEGKTYKFDNIEVKYAKDVSEDDKAIVDGVVAATKKVIQDYKMTFEADGKITSSKLPVGTYTQDGSKLTIKIAAISALSAEYKVSGSKLTATSEDDKGNKTIITFVEVK